MKQEIILVLMFLLTGCGVVTAPQYMCTGGDLKPICQAMFGYGADNEGNAWIGDFSMVFLGSVTEDAVSGGIPLSLHAMFQMTFAIITPALIVGAFAERVKFSSMLLFSGLWLFAVYIPVCHWVWSGSGWLFQKGLLDFAGGTVVHITAGVAALVAAIVVGKRNGFPTTAMPPHNMTMTVTGAGMLWVGWFGFNVGSELAVDGISSLALNNTQLATAAAVFGWVAAEWLVKGKPSMLGAASGAVAGLVAITPASVLS